MPEILLTPEHLEEEAGKLERSKMDMDDAFNQIQTLVSGLLDNWHGEAQQAFQTSFEGKKPTFNQLAQDMANFASFMRTYSRHMQDSERGSAQRASAL